MLNTKLKELRERLGYSQAYIADTLKISRVSYNRYEKGEREPDYETLYKIANFFNVSVDFLIGGNNPKIIENKKIPKDLKRILEEEEITLNGRMMSAEDKDKIYKVIEIMYNDAKEQNKRK